MLGSRVPCLKAELIQGRPLQLRQLVLCEAAAARLGVEMEADSLRVPLTVNKAALTVHGVHGRQRRVVATEQPACARAHASMPAGG